MQLKIRKKYPVVFSRVFLLRYAIYEICGLTYFRFRAKIEMTTKFNFFFREIIVRTRHPGGNGNFSPGKDHFLPGDDLPGEKLPFPPGWRVRTMISRKKNEKV